MLLDFDAIYKEWDLDIHGVVHVGAHLGEEAQIYDGLGINKVVWVDANPDVMSKLHVNVDPYHHLCINALLSDEDKEEVKFNVTNYDGMSSSVFEFGTHPQFSPDTVVEQIKYLPATTLDNLAAVYNFDGCDMLNIDTEGSELMILKGGIKTLPQFQLLYLEVRTDNVYDGAPLVDEMDAFLSPDFERVSTGMVDGQGWGDAIYMRMAQ